MTLGALEPKFWQAFCRGVGREDLIEQQFERPGSEAHAEVEAVFAGRTRAEWEAFGAEHDCCLEPVLELDEALDSELVRARDGGRAGAAGRGAPVRLLGVPVKLSRTPGDPARAPGPVLGADTEAVLAEAGYDERQIDMLMAERGGLRGDRGRVGRRELPGVKPGLKMSELADASGVSAATIKHYLREGLLGGDEEIVRTSRNMAYYPPSSPSGSGGSSGSRASASCRCG